MPADRSSPLTGFADLSIRPYTEADAAPLACLFTASVHALAVAHYSAAQRAAWAPELPDTSEWQQRFATLQTLIANDHGTPVGFISFHMAGHIALLFTAPEYARRGVASLLYAAAEQALLDTGVREFRTEASLVGRPFFERQGFRIIEEQQVRVRGTWFRRYAMLKTNAPGECAPG